MDLEITQDVLNVTEYEKRKVRPATLIDRAGRTWLTCDSPLVGENVDWGLCKEGEIVRVPMFPYLSRANDPAVALGFAFELGFRARHLVEPKFMVNKLHITIGHPVTEYTLPEGQETLRFWLGFAFVLEKLNG